MDAKTGLATLMLSFSLCLTPSVEAASLDGFADALQKLADVARVADRSRERLDDAKRRGSDVNRYERIWYEDEQRLEDERVRVMAKCTGISESQIRDFRKEGQGWDHIARRYDIEPTRFGYGISRFDAERNQWKGVPPGLAKKEGVPPGLDKKDGVPPGQEKKDQLPPDKKRKNADKEKKNAEKRKHNPQQKG